MGSRGGASCACTSCASGAEAASGVEIERGAPEDQAGFPKAVLSSASLHGLRGIHAEGRPSDSGRGSKAERWTNRLLKGDSSSSPRHVDVQRVATDLKGGGLAQMLEQASEMS